MQLFELVSPRLFRPLAGPNRAFYAELLLLLWEECRHTADYSISRAEAVWRAEDYFAALAKPLALDADGAGDEDEQPPATLTRWPWAFCCGCAAPAGWKSSPAATRGSVPCLCAGGNAAAGSAGRNIEPPRSYLYRKAVQGMAAAGQHRAGKKPL